VERLASQAISTVSNVFFKPLDLPREFDLRPAHLGYTMRGWDFTRSEIADAINSHRMLNPAIELGTNVCPWGCLFCFTENPDNPSGRKLRLKTEMSLGERLSLIDQAAALGARSINWVGAGEPTIDPDFWEIIEHIAKSGITPIIYSEGALRLTKRDFVKRLYAVGATVVLKVNSLWDHEYQNAIVRGASNNSAADSYTQRRNRALELLLEEGFADCDPTRLAMDTIISKQNMAEVPALHRYARKHNIFVLFVNYLPSGRSTDGVSDALTREQQLAVFEELAQIDAEEFGIIHRSKFPYAGGVPCSIRGTGLFVKITGQVFDCPGELMPLGNIRTESLSSIWSKARPITKAFDGGCAPRDEFWRVENAQKNNRQLPVLMT
jgi:MoaA/NifB/PqqE/SkfB family radical SAM enzyme